MAHVFLHLTSLRLLEADENLHPLARECLRRRADAADLGAVLYDLPRFEGVKDGLFGPQLGSDQAQSAWFARFHHDGPMRLLRQLVAPRDEERALGPVMRLSLGLGVVAHAALDTALHPLVHRLSQREEDPARAHRRVERFQAALIHPRLTGTTWEQDQVLLSQLQFSGLASLPRLLAHAARACRTTYDNAPSAEAWQGWVAGLGAYGALVRERPERAEGGSMSVDEARARYLDGPGFADALVLAQARAVAWCNRLALHFEDGDLGAQGMERLLLDFADVPLDAPEDPVPSGDLGQEIHQQRGRTHMFAMTRLRSHRKDNTALGNPQAGRAPPPLVPPPDGPNDEEEDETKTQAEMHAQPMEGASPTDSDQDGPSLVSEEGTLRPKGRTPR